MPPSSSSMQCFSLPKSFSRAYIRQNHTNTKTCVCHNYAHCERTILVWLTSDGTCSPSHPNFLGNEAKCFEWHFTLTRQISKKRNLISPVSLCVVIAIEVQARNSSSGRPWNPLQTTFFSWYTGSTGLTRMLDWIFAWRKSKSCFLRVFCKNGKPFFVKEII